MQNNLLFLPTYDKIKIGRLMKMNDNTARKLDLKTQKSQINEQIKTLSSQPVIDLNTARGLKKQIEEIELEIKQLEAQEEQRRRENNQSVMQFLQTEHLLKDLDDYNAVTKEKLDFKEEQDALAKEIKEQVTHIHLACYYYPNYAQDYEVVTGFDTINDIYYAKENLESYREDIKNILEQVAGLDIDAIGYLKSGVAWATSKLDTQKLFSLGNALGLIPDPRKPKLIEIEESENFGRH